MWHANPVLSNDPLLLWNPAKRQILAIAELTFFVISVERFLFEQSTSAFPRPAEYDELRELEVKY